MAQGIRFWDHSKRLDWFYARAITRKILAKPEMIGELRNAAEACWADDPSKRRCLQLWRDILRLSAPEFVQMVLSDSAKAEEVRESFPPYVALTPAERAEVIRQCRLETAQI